LSFHLLLIDNKNASKDIILLDNFLSTISQWRSKSNNKKQSYRTPDFQLD